jgi:cell division protein FtsZ
MTSEAHGETKKSRPSKLQMPRPLGQAQITVIGVGGGGSNAVTRVMQRNIPNVNFICVNTDTKALSQVKGAKVIQIGAKATHGFGAGGNPDVGELAMEESRAAVVKALKGSDLVFVTVGMGGGTGTGAAPVVAQIARDAGALVVGLVTTPFAFEGERRMEVSLAGAARLKQHCHNLIVIHNDRLLRLVKQEVPIDEAFARADEAVTQGIAAVAQIVNEPAEINVDFADVRAILAIPGRALLAVGMGHGPTGPVDAAQQAIDNPLLDISIQQAQGVLFQVVGGPDMTLGQVNQVGRLIGKNVDKRAMIFFGMATDPNMVGRSRITILATGIPEEVRSAGLNERQVQMSKLLATPTLTRN